MLIDDLCCHGNTIIMAIANFAITQFYASLYLAHLSLETKCGAGLPGYYSNHCNHGNKELCNKNMRKYFEFIFGTNILCDSMY